MSFRSHLVSWFVAVAVILSASGFFWSTKSTSARDPQSLLVRFKLPNFKENLQNLKNARLDITGVDLNTGTVDLYLNEVELREAIAIVGEDPVAKRTFTNSAPDSRYYNAQKVANRLQELANAHPQIAALKSIGTSVEGRDIWAIKISDNVAQEEAEEPAVLFNAMHHAREVMTTEVAMDTVEYLLAHYSTDARVANWVDQAEIWIVPMLNVDGNNKVWMSDAMWRKNARGSYGVDINRNYPYTWNTCNGSSGFPMAQDYRGPSAASEPETRALMSLVASIRPVLSMSYHSYSEILLYPLGCKDKRVEERAVIEGFGKELADLIPSDDNPAKKYRAGTPWELLYSVDGGDIDWMYKEFGVMAYVYELNSSQLGFQPSYAPWRDRTVTKVRAGWMRMLDRLFESGLSVQLTGLNGVQLAKAKVSISRLQADKSAGTTYSANAQGRVFALLEPGDYSVKAVVPGRNPVVQEVSIGGQRADIDLEL